MLEPLKTPALPDMTELQKAAIREDEMSLRFWCIDRAIKIIGGSTTDVAVIKGCAEKLAGYMKSGK